MKANVGFIGCGTLGGSIAAGLASAKEFDGEIFISEPFNKTRAEELNAKYPDKVIVVNSHEELLEKADIVFPTILPNILHDVMSTLSFSARHKVIHVAAGVSLAQANCYAGAGKVLRAVPLPFAARHIGPQVLYGDDEECEKLFSLFGTLIKVPTERALEVLAVHTGMMVPYYAIVNEVVEWSQKKGMELEDARDYICAMNAALSELLVADDIKDIKGYMVSIATAGGTNEEAHRILSERNCYAPWQTAMESIGKRYGL